MLQSGEGEGLTAKSGQFGHTSGVAAVTRSLLVARSASCGRLWENTIRNMRQTMAAKKASVQTVAGIDIQNPAISNQDVMNGKLDQMIRLLEEQLHLQKVALLEAGHILRFNGPGAMRIAFSLPDAQDDYLQRVILRTRGFYEARLLSMVAALDLVGPESVVCDIGANIGNHTVYFGKVMGAAKVLAFEPQAHCHATLTENIALNGLQDRAVAYNCLIGAATGNGAMARFSARNLGGTAFTARDDGNLPLFALDDVIEAPDMARLDLIKVDVEGMQQEVLKGAEGVLDRRHPAIWIELLAKDNTFDLVRLYLERFGYKPTALGFNDVLFRV